MDVLKQFKLFKREVNQCVTLTQAQKNCWSFGKVLSHFHCCIWMPLFAIKVICLIYYGQECKSPRVN